MKPKYIIYNNKRIIRLKVTEGESKIKKWNKETKKMEETNEVRHWRCQNFAIPLGKNGSTDLGYVDCEYWGEKNLVEGQCIQVGQYYLKQKKWQQKDPHTFIVKTFSKVMLVLVDFDKLIEYNDTPSRKLQLIAKNKSPEQMIKMGEFDMAKDFGQSEEPKEELVNVNEEFEKKVEL